VGAEGELIPTLRWMCRPGTGAGDADRAERHRGLQYFQSVIAIELAVCSGVPRVRPMPRMRDGPKLKAADR
jgi:hypothetical protein